MSRDLTEEQEVLLEGFLRFEKEFIRKGWSEIPRTKNIEDHLQKLLETGVSPSLILEEIKALEKDGYSHKGKRYKKKRFKILRKLLQDPIAQEDSEKRLHMVKGTQLPDDLWQSISEFMPKRASSKKRTRKKGKSKKKKKALTKKLSPETYKELIHRKQAKKRMTKKQKKQLDDELFVNYCKCLKKLKYEKKDPKGREYPYCAASVYKNRGFAMPEGVTKKCRDYTK
jgi:hypothetical protein